MYAVLVIFQYETIVPVHDIKIQPGFCQYADGHCDQDFRGIAESRAVFLYPSEPAQIAATVEGAVSVLRASGDASRWLTWRDLETGGQIIFCSICKNMRFAEGIVADVTTLNFNLLFEIGFALGLELPVIPVRDTTFVRDRVAFDELGLLDTIGYLDFQNSEGLARALQERWPPRAIPMPPSEINREAPLYVLKGPIDTEGAVRLMSTLKKSALRFRTYDSLETARLPLQEARKQVATSIGIVAHLLAPDRDGSLVHNARCALVAGVAMATGKAVLLLQEGHVKQPIDYRDVVAVYKTPDQVPGVLEPLIRQVVTRLQDVRLKAAKVPENVLQRLDLGDVAAENEIQALQAYFVRTAQFNDAKRGHARLLVGRKGSGKTAIFYAVRDSFAKGRAHLVLDLKPEGHQFTKLREVVLQRLSPGLQEHTLTAFWNYILLCEIAQKVRDYDHSWAQRDTERWNDFQNLMKVFGGQAALDPGDFSERLLIRVNRLTERFNKSPTPISAGQLTQALFEEDIRGLDNVLARYLRHKEQLWVLVDNLDKGWPTGGASTADILIIRSLLEATRKLQQQFEDRGVDFHSIVFLRNDIHDLLVDQTPDKGKETAITLDWDDPEVLRELVLQRMRASTGLGDSFDEVWPVLFDAHVNMEDSFRFVIDRTLMRPRDLLNFLHRAVEVAVNRGHDRVREADFLKAGEIYSEDILKETAFEIRDVYKDIKDPLYVFLGEPNILPPKRVQELLTRAGFTSKQVTEVTNLLVWFGFLGVKNSDSEEAQFSYQVRYNVVKLLEPVRRGKGAFVIHPAFRSALQ